MKRNHIIIIVLFIITIAAVVFSVTRNKKPVVVDYCNHPDGSYDESCASMAEESQWANGDGDMPKGWFTWEELIEGSTVQAKGPVKNGSSMIITTRDLELVEKLKQKDSTVKCLGDSELITCSIGSHPEVIRYWKVINYFN